MKATFLVTVDLGEGDTLNNVSREIFDMLEDAFVVHEVKAWKRPSSLEVVQPVAQGGGQVLPILPPPSGGPA